MQASNPPNMSHYDVYTHENVLATEPIKATSKSLIDSFRRFARLFGVVTLPLT
jgi:hypothetical protein